MKILFVSIIIFLSAQICVAQQSGSSQAMDTSSRESSGISTITLTTSSEKNLHTLALIWGFLKYYHPVVAKGDINWDYELFKILPEVLKTGSTAERDDILVNWIEKLGTFKIAKKKESDTSDLKFGPDLEWIHANDLSPKLSALLTNIRYADRNGKNYYVSLKPGVLNPDFSHEEAYKNICYPDAGFRLLSLYRYWNIIQYYFPYKNLIKEDWKEVLLEFIPKAIAASNQMEYTLTMLELIGRIHDTHANIWGSNPVVIAYRGNRFAALDLNFVEGKAVVTGYYDDEKGAATGIKIGDVVTAVNGKPVEDIVSGMLKYTPASNYSTQLRDIAPKLLRTNDSTIVVNYVADSKSQNALLKTYLAKDINVYKNYENKDSCFRIIENNIAYLNNGSVKKNYLPAIWKDIEDTKGLIIDDRNYPSDFVIFSLTKLLMPDAIPFVKFSRPSIEEPGLYQLGKPLSAGVKNNKGYKGKVVILVNELTQSSAEYHAMAYRVFPGAVVMGSTTAGADGNVSQFFLPGGISTMISGIGIYYPDGRETQGAGIVPDIFVQPTIAGIKAGKDEVLERAVKFVNE